MCCTLLSAFPIVSHLTPSQSGEVDVRHYAHFIDEDTEK